MENHYVPRKNWFERNWKWFVPTGCLTLLIVIGLLFTGLYFGITSVMKSSDVYKHSMEVAQKNRLIIEKIGNNIDSEQPISGSITTSNSSGNAQLDITLKGSNGQGLLHVEAEKRNDIWIYKAIDFYPKNSTTPFSLLEPASTNP